MKIGKVPENVLERSVFKQLHTNLIFSYFFSLKFVAMIGLIIGLFRTITFFLYEKNDKSAPLYWPFIFSILSIGAYFLGIELQNSQGQYADILCVVALCMYAFIFRIRDFKIVKFTVLVPTILSIIYNILVQAPFFNTLSYSFELGANILAIILYYRTFNKETILSFNKGDKNEQD